MLAQAVAWQKRHQPQRASQVTFRLGTEEDLTSTDQFDAILTFFFLDLFTPAELEHVAQRLHTTRRPGAPWLLADFVPPTRWWHRRLLAVMYRFFRLTTGISAQTLPPTQTILAQLGLQPRHRRLFFGEMIEATVFEKAAAN